MARSKPSLSAKLSRTTGLQLVLVAGSLSALSFSLGRNSGFQQIEAHRATVPVVRVAEQLSRKLSYPTIINDLNVAAVSADPELLNDFDRLSHRFWRQLKSFPVDYINYGSTDGSFLGIEKLSPDHFAHNEDSQRFGRGTMQVYSMDANGQRLALDDAIPGMSTSHEEAWYVDTVKAGQPSWSTIYAWEDQPDVFSISYNAPIYNKSNKLLGVVGVDMVINQLSTWLQDAWKNQQGLALIVEANGDLVASSQANTLLIGKGDQPQRANLKDITLPLAAELHTQFREANIATQQGAKQSLNNTSPRVIELDDQHYLINSTPWGDNYGLNWHLLTAIPADEEWRSSELILYLSVITSVAAIGLALAINRRLIKGILTPLTALTSASKSTEVQIEEEAQKREFATPVSYACTLPASSTEEIAGLNKAIQALVQAFNRLTQTLREKDERELKDISQKLKISLEAAAIGHEINQPLSIVRLTAQSLLNTLKLQGPGQSSPALNEGLTTLNAQTERIATITEKMRSLLRNAQTNLGPVDLQQVIDNSIRYVQSNHRNGDWIATHASDASPGVQAVIEGDAVQLQVALINLLKNGLDALAGQTRSENAPPPSVGITLNEQDDQWRIDVDDNGPGLSQDLLGSMPLSTSKPDGSGLGLFIVRTAVESHQGELTLTTNAWGGLKASINLPKSRT